jgi:cytochrome c-type biogenesis protein CcmH/NrfG
MTDQIKKAQMFFQQDQLPESFETLNQYISSNVTDIQALMLRARISCKMQKWGEAMNDYSSVLEIQPENQEAKTGLEMVKNILGYFTPDMFNP